MVYYGTPEEVRLHGLNKIGSLREDRKGNLYIVTSNNVVYFDRYKNTFQNLNAELGIGEGLHTTVNEATFNDWLLCTGPAIQAEHLNGLEFACPSGRRAKRRRGLHLFFKKKVENESPTYLLK